MKVTVSIQPKQKVTVTNQAKPSVSVYRKGDTGQSAYQLAVVLGYTGTESEWIDSLHNPVTLVGAKQTSVDAGVQGQRSITDDYEYVCVTGGIAESTVGVKDGTAIWKKTILFQT